MGVPRLTQFRIQENSCKVPKELSAYKTNCRTQFDSAKMEKGAFGKGLTNMSESDITYSA
jgi:hypothetical protein